MGAESCKEPRKACLRRAAKRGHEVSRRWQRVWTCGGENGGAKWGREARDPSKPMTRVGAQLVAFALVDPAREGAALAVG